MRRALLTVSAVVSITCVLAVVSTPVFAQEDDMEPVPITAFKNIDLNGTWNFKTTQPKVSGGCPAGNAMAGTAALTQEGTAVTLRYVSGVRCQPAAVCSYEGTLEEENHQLVVSNAVDVDDEGGTVSSAIRLTVVNNELAEGEGTNEYHHPEGFECRWDMDLVFTRNLEEEE